MVTAARKELLATMPCGPGDMRFEKVPEPGVERPADAIWFRPREKRWHGASTDRAITHAAIARALDGRSVDWAEHASDADYPARHPR